MIRKSAIAVVVLGMTASYAQAAAITKDEVLAAQQAWAEGIVGIGRAYQDAGDYRAAAAQHIRDLYAYEQGGVLFKPTLAAEDQFRETFEQALSYFVGGKLEEDKGFAIKPWVQVRFAEPQVLLNGDTAAAMGNYYFTAAGSDAETKVEYSFGYIRDDEGRLRINLHHSSVPYGG